MADIDDLLSATLKRVAQPGDPAGVADAIRARVAAGDTGTSVERAGWRSGRLRRWFPWIGLLLVLLIVVGGIGAAQYAGQASVYVAGPTSTPSPAASATPSGSPTPLPSATVATPTPSATTTHRPHPHPHVNPPVVVAKPPHHTPPKPRDTRAPVLANPSADPTTIAARGQSGSCNVPSDRSTVTVTATDNVRVTSVRASWAGGNASLTKSGTSWHFLFQHAAAQQDAVYAITLVARDAAGNTSNSALTRVQVKYCRV